MAVSHLLDAGCDPARVQGVPPRGLRTIEQMIHRGFHAPLTSSAGRLFDAVAAIAGVRSQVSYEGQAAVELEWLATEVGDDGRYPFELESASQGPPRRDSGEPKTSHTIDTRPLIRGVARDVERNVSARVIARRFHSTIVDILETVCEQIRSQLRIETAVLSGGVFLNALLTREVCRRLRSHGFRVYRHRLVPPNDGGLSLGQLAIAARSVGRCSPAGPIPGQPRSQNARTTGHTIYDKLTETTHVPRDTRQSD
jgi:hydrogenase maturation protein HypF